MDNPNIHTNSSLLSLIYIAGDKSESAKVLVPNALMPLDAIRVIAEQTMFGMFVGRFAPNTYTDYNFFRTLNVYLHQLPNRIVTGNSATDELYTKVYKFLDRFLNKSRVDYICFDQVATDNEKHDLLLTLRELFNTPVTKKEGPNSNYNLYYTGTMTESFLVEWCCLFFDYYDVRKYDDGILSNGTIYLPTVKVQKADHYVNIYKEPRDRLVIALEPKALRSFNLRVDREKFGMPLRVLDYLSRFDLRDYSPDDIIAFLASLCISHNQYVMTSWSNDDDSVALTALCFDLVTGSSYTADCAGSYLYKTAVNCFVNWIKELQETNGIQQIADYALFGDLLTKCGESTDIVNYFVKPVNAISATESYAFRNSVYASIFKDRVLAGMEALEDEEANPQDDETADTDETASGGDANTADLGDNPDTGLDDSFGGGTDDTTTAAQEKPPIDPDKMLLELAGPNESMKDYVFRDTIAKRIVNTLKNPPENASPNDLIMLKRWLSRWLYLASVACLRDFLTRLSLRLSDV